MRKRTSTRTVLGFFAAEQGNPDDAFRAIHKSGVARGSLFRADGGTATGHTSRDALRRYSSLRLSEESLVVARVEPGNVRRIVDALRNAGASAVFALRDDATETDAAGSQRAPHSIPDRLSQAEVDFNIACADLDEAILMEHALPPAAEWLLDNSYLLRSHVAEVRQHVPSEFAGDSPAAMDLYARAREWVRAVDCAVSAVNIATYLREQQKERTFSTAELWVSPLMLRTSLVEALTELAMRVSRSQQLREAAYLWANRLATSARRGPEDLEQMIGRMETEAISREPYFAVSLAEQLHDEESALAPAQRRLEERLNARLPDLVQAEHTREAAERISAANAFGSLRMLSHLDFKVIFESVSAVEQTLRGDPAGVYSRSDFATRDDCRHVIEQVARYSGLSEIDVARRAIALAGANRTHVAYYLLADGLKQLESEAGTRPPVRTRVIRGVRRHATPLYISAVAGLTACFTALALAIAHEGGVNRLAMLIVLGALALFPLSELSIQIVNALVISLLPPRRLPKLDFRDGIPEECATLVAIPMMLSSVEVARAEVEKLEVRFLANPGANLWYALLSDYTDSSDPTAPSDPAVLEAARAGINDLNRRHPGERFVLLHRRRVWSTSEQSWIGRERKRGKVEELNAFLCGEGSRDLLHAGRLARPIRYVITLDADTQLPPGAARRMIETIAHPLNQVELDPETHIRRRGFSVIQPRVSIALPDANATRFTRVFADAYGTDPYSLAVSDAQQDLFGEAIFHGKAIYDVRAFTEALRDRFPAETLLSHDLIEGAHAGVALASDIELFENLPQNYAAFSKREHRWIRGDWQIARWTMRRGNPLTVLNRWRILDNLRRSLVPIASLLLLLFGWLISAAPGVWTLVVGLAIAIPAIAPLLDRGARCLQGAVRGWQGAADQLVRAVIMIAFLPHQAWMAMDAIVRANYRMLISRRKLLEWETAERSGALANHHLNSTLRQMLWISALSCALMIALEARAAFAPTILFVLLWAVAPALMLWLSHPPEGPRTLDKRDKLYLRNRARRTWRYFDDLVAPENNWLPPDNSQLALRVEVAQRTSPTNIGLWLVSALAARDFGYLTPQDFLRRCSKTMETVARLERYEGHLLNWYDTRTLEALPPRYVSTVDSGNLLAALWVLAAGCRDVCGAPLIGATAIHGLSDTLAVLREAAGRDPSMAVPLRHVRNLLHASATGHDLIGRLRLASIELRQLVESRRWFPEKGDERAYWLSRFAAELDQWTLLADRYLRWVETLASPPDSLLNELGEDTVKLRRRALMTAPSLASLAAGAAPALDQILARRGLPELPPEAAGWLDQLQREYQEARVNAAAEVKNADALAGAAVQLASGIDMRFLYDASRRVFAVGYAVGAPLEFTSHYDLLASECRLASMVAIAKGDVPAEHWMSLARPQSSGKEPVLLSWSGTMFEYLMPLLFQRRFRGSLLDHACRGAVDRQIAYGRERKIPWGISESAFSALDAHQTYQYRAFGVPDLALKRGLEDDMVVAPYATMLALLVDPVAAIDNLKRLEDLGLAGPMGFYESIDFARERKRGGERGVVIYTYMAHHQGMSLIALDDVLHRDTMKRRFHSDLRVRAFESLLWERVSLARQPHHQIETRHAPVTDMVFEESGDRVWKSPTRFPRVHLSGNGRYTMALTNAGGGHSRWGDFDITRWRSDSAVESWGSFLYLREPDSQAVWSATPQPVGAELGVTTVTFSVERAQFRRNVSGIETVMEVTVAAEDDAELRRVTVANRSLHTRTVELTSYVELAMAPHRADTAHPAFSKLFVETEYVGDGVLIAHRRPRSPDDPPIWVAHALAGHSGPIQYETDRARFLGRGRSVRSPQAMERDLSRTTGAVLDPMFSLRCRLKLEPRARMELSFLTLAASSREALLEMVAKYRRSEIVARAFEMAWTRAQLEMRYLGVRPAAAHRFQALAGQLLYPNPGMRRTARHTGGQAALWANGISGDLPILTVTIADDRGVSLVRELLLAHSYWRLLGFRADMVILNQEGVSYDRPLNHQLRRLVEAHAGDQPGGIFVLDWNAIPEADRNVILSASSVVLGGNRGPLSQQMVTAADSSWIPPFVPTARTDEHPSVPLPFLELPYFNGLGGFHQDGREYAIYLGEGRATPAPWANIMANERFGASVSESGLGFTWNRNSQANRLTPWHNDPASDPQSEAIYLRDDESGALWTPTALPIREKDPYRARHGQGYTVFEHNSHAIGQELTVFVPRFDPVKIYRLRLRNDSSRTRRLTVTYFAELVLGSVREEQQLHVGTSFDEASGAIFASQTWTGSAAGHTAFAAASPRAQSWSGDRTAFLGHNQSLAAPAALDRTRLDQRSGAGLDPAAALQLSVAVSAASHVDVVFLLGQAETEPAAREIITRYSTPASVENALREARDAWDTLLEAIQVRTPEPSADLLLNRWLMYQVLSCRFWGRSATYQSGGAFGFRDQLQDSMALVYAAPSITREHILASAARQFVEGDVQHWWHPDTGLGVRTRCSDDLLWLPYVTAHYVEVTGDWSILQESVPFLEGPALASGEQERMFVPSISAHRSPLLDHCRRAIEQAWKLGPHGLPLIGSGDWNDGLNRVGVDGRGESVWLAWFFCAVLDSFARLGGNLQESAAYRARSAELSRAVERTSWDGEWYLRGFFDDGLPLGSHLNSEAQIDSLPQSWAVLSGTADPARARRAMDSATLRLVDPRDRIVKLFTPPFDHSTPYPGYIMGYPPGVRENGGQYTHGSLWLAMACARLGDGDQAVRLLQMMNPLEHTGNPESVARYTGEPYVAAADVYAAPNRSGRSGWTWYTGSAAWMYRVWIEEVLGFKLRGETLLIDPVMPHAWPGFEIDFRFRSSVYRITVEKQAAVHETADPISLVDDGAVHDITIAVPVRNQRRPPEMFPAGRDLRIARAPESAEQEATPARRLRLQKG